MWCDWGSCVHFTVFRCNSNSESCEMDTNPQTLYIDCFLFWLTSHIFSSSSPLPLFSERFLLLFSCTILCYCTVVPLLLLHTPKRWDKMSLVFYPHTPTPPGGPCFFFTGFRRHQFIPFRTREEDKTRNCLLACATSYLEDSASPRQIVLFFCYFGLDAFLFLPFHSSVDS